MTARVRTAAGPADPPSSRPAAGVLDAAVHAYRFAPASGVQRVRLDAPDREVTADTVLHWAFYADDDAAAHAPWASLAVCVDVVFDDGSRLSDGAGGAPTVDRYGFAVTSAAQFAARWAMPEQWNADTVSLAPWAGRRIVAVEAVLGDESLRGAAAPDAAAGFVQAQLAEQPVSPTTHPAELVDTRRGTHAGPRFSRGNTLPLVAVPHGFAFLTPATDADSSSWPYRPYLHDDDAGRRFEAIQISHQPSPWIGDHTVLQFMPFAGVPAPRRVDRRRWIRPGTEQALPHRYAAALTGAGGDIALEATATSRVALVRVRGEGAVGLVLDQLADDGHIEVSTGPDGRVRVSGWVREGSADWGNAPRMYFAGEASGTGDRLPRAQHPAVTAAVHGEGVVELRVATSFLSVAQARRTLAREAPWTRSFQDIQDAARDAWDAVCGAIELPAEPDPRRALADAELRAQLAGDLYRLHLYPNDASEDVADDGPSQWRFADVFAAASAHGDEATGAPVADGRLVVNNGYWDTYRTVWPMLNLLDGPGSGALLDGQLEQARRSGWMTRWSAPGFVDCMVGTSSDQIFADAAVWGADGLDAAAAFETGWRNACEPAADRRAGRAGIATARFTGYMSQEVPEGFSWSIEAAIADAGLARFARHLGAQRLAAGHSAAADADAARYTAFARYFANRALSYRQLFDADAGFFRGRDRDGAFPAGFDARSWGGDFVETNGWGMSVSAVHDGAGTAALYGGPAGLRAHLDRLFTEPETADAAFGGSYGGVIHEQREARAQRSGMCALSNQPAHHIPYMHVHGDQPWRAGATAHALARRLFAGSMIGQGYPGDEDNGEMSAWWLWALIGLYPLELASGELIVGDPLVDDVTVRRAGGGMLRVCTHRSSADAHALRRVVLNGTPLPRAVLPIAALTGEDLLELEFGDEPVRSLWPDEQALPWHPDLTSPQHAAGAPAVFDDRAGATAAVALAAGECVGQDFGRPQRVTDLSLTVCEATPGGALVLERSDDGATWTVVPATHAQALPADRTTPFQLSRPGSARHWRVRAVRPVVLRQVELFCLDA